MATVQIRPFGRHAPGWFIKAIQLALNPRERAEIMFDKHYRNAAVFFDDEVKMAGRKAAYSCLPRAGRRRVTRISLDKQADANPVKIARRDRPMIKARHSTSDENSKPKICHASTNATLGD